VQTRNYSAKIEPVLRGLTSEALKRINLPANSKGPNRADVNRFKKRKGDPPGPPLVSQYTEKNCEPNPRNPKKPEIKYYRAMMRFLSNAKSA
jgi:hypothetical protein